MFSKYGICYEIIKNNKVRGYLFGSFHIFFKNKNFKECIIKSFKESDCLILEVNIEKSEIDKSLDITKIEESIYYEDGDTALNHLKTKEDKKNYKKLLKPFGLKRYLIMDTLKKFKIESLKKSYKILYLQNKGISPQYSIDKYFFELSKEMNKDVLFLEEIQFQLDLLKNLNNELAIEQDSIKDDEVIDVINDDFENFDDYMSLCNNEIKDMIEFVNNYRNNNIKSLKKYVNKEFENMPFETRDSILLNRNLNMTEKIDIIMNEDKTPFICIGLAHLIAENNVVSMLRDKGYSLNLL